MRRSLLPAATVPRPALAILQEVFEGARVASFGEIRERLGAPRTTLIRNLGALVDASLAYRDRRDRYVLPRPSTLGLLLVEPDAYVRSLLLHEDVLPALGVRRWAFACLPLRRALDVDLPHAIPVVSPALAGTTPRASPTIVWHDYEPDAVGKTTMLFPSWAKDDPDRTSRTLPTLHPREGLALLAATGDSRMTQAAQRAARKLHVRPDAVAKAARRLAIEPPSRKLRYPNSVILPKWLLRFAETARESSAKERLARDLLGGDTP
ncbi:MAG TPA: hypothetical protein VNX21_03830 [Candidatus Thermoplasmatota archaeon]|nr:hypothetical protein [Candidatus Thermoplasmatota archaeon]